MNKIKTLLLCAGLALAAPAASASVIGATNGPDDSFTIDFFFGNSGAPAISSLTIDGTTAVGALDVIWDFIGAIGGSAVVGSSAGEDTSIMSFLFNSFAMGDTFSLSGIDPDYVGLPSAGLTIIDLVGVTVTALFSDQSTAVARFIDDPNRGAGLVLELVPVAPIPVPVPASMLLGGLAALALAARRRRQV